MKLNQGKILIVDDDEYIRLSVQMFLEGHFARVDAIGTPEQIPEMMRKTVYDAVLLDMNFTKGDTTGKSGLSWLERILAIDSGVSVILITAYGGVEMAVKAIKQGAFDFIIKPWQNEKLLTTLLAAVKLSHSSRKVEKLHSQKKLLNAQIDQPFVNIIGRSQAIQSVMDTVEKVASTDANVLILGENGTGKELIARAIHRQSLRSEELFVGVDVGTISETLFESELFGHKKGAFTDAKEDRVGRFEMADGGTLFLDEIGNLSAAGQVKLLSALQNRQITRVGMNQPIDVNIRLVSATNMPLKAMINDGRFRQDLLYRINTVEIVLPPLRDREGDIELLAEYFADLYSQKYQKQIHKIPDYVLKKLGKYSWPGNIRELQHAMERAVILSEDKTLRVNDFLFLNDESESQNMVESLNLEELEAWALKTALTRHHGNVSKAAKEVGLTRGAMYRRMEKYGL